MNIWIPGPGQPYPGALSSPEDNHQYDSCCGIHDAVWLFRPKLFSKDEAKYHKAMRGNRVKMQDITLHP